MIGNKSKKIIAVLSVGLLIIVAGFTTAFSRAGSKAYDFEQANTKLNVPEECTLNYLGIKVDVNIKVPQYEKFPVFGVDINQKLSQEAIDNFTEKVVGNAPLYEIDPEYSRYNNGEYKLRVTLDKPVERIKHKREKYDWYAADTGNEEKTLLVVDQCDGYYKYDFSYIENVNFDSNIGDAALPLPYLENTSEEDARRQALEFLSELGLDNYTVEDVNIIILRPGLLSEGVHTEYIYAINCAKDFGNGITVKPNAYRSSRDHNYPYGYFEDLEEDIMLYINDRGICYGYWAYPYGDTEMLQQDVQLISFDEIKTHIEQHLQGKYKDSQEGKKAIEQIQEIRLEYTLSQFEDDTYGVVLPTWNVYGKEDKPIISLSAIDGNAV